MDTNFGELTSSLRFLVDSNAAAVRAVPQLTGFLKENDIQTVFIRPGRKADGAAAATLLRDEFKVVLECTALNYRRFIKEPARGLEKVGLLPAFDVSGSVSELKTIVGLLPARKGPASLLIRNESKSTDTKRIQKAFDAVIKTVGRKYVKFFWDCGFVLCAFTENELGYFIQNGSEIQFTCPSFLNVDTKLNIHVCDKLKGRLEAGRALPGNSLMDAVSTLGPALVPYQSFGLYSRCGTCPSFQKVCCGGCKAIIMNSFR